MAGQLKVNGVTLATEESGTVTLEAPQIKDSSNNVILDQSGTNPVLKNVEVVNNSPMMFRNKIINGDMRIDQRNAGASTTISAYGYGIDRWGYQCFGGGAWSSQRTTVVPSGHGNSLGLIVTTADGSIGSTDVYQLFQKVEGFNAADLGFGTANAKTITVSFWVRSSITGTYSASFQNNGFNRGYVATFEVNAADTWEYKTLTVIGDTSGTWTIDNSVGLQLAIDLGSGSGSNITAGSWQTVTTSSLRTSGSVDWVGTLNATFYITGVQLEEGTVATPFEHRPYGVELSLAQRYFQVIRSLGSAGARSSTDVEGNIQYLQQMRSTPSISLSAPYIVYDLYGNAKTQSSINVSIGVVGYKTSTGAAISLSNFTGLTQGRIQWSGNGGNILLNAEL